MTNEPQERMLIKKSDLVYFFNQNKAGDGLAFWCMLKFYSEPAPLHTDAEYENKNAEVERLTALSMEYAKKCDELKAKLDKAEEKLDNVLFVDTKELLAVGDSFHVAGIEIERLRAELAQTKKDAPPKDRKPYCFSAQAEPGCRGILVHIPTPYLYTGPEPEKRFRIECALCPLLETEYKDSPGMGDEIKKRVKATLDNDWVLQERKRKKES